MSNKFNLVDNPLKLPYLHYPIALMDYLYIITFYVIVAICLAILIDGHILIAFDEQKARQDTTLVLGSKIIGHIALQGFIVIFIALILEKIPSPVDGIFGYDSHGSLGKLVRNTAIITTILFILSASLRRRLAILFDRFSNKNIW
jgi:hypothetical protein